MQRALGRKAELAVDLGCGAGHSLAGLFSIASRVVGIEPGEQLRSAAAARYPEAVMIGGAGEAVPLPSASADLVTAANAFYWMKASAALAEVSRILKRPGVFAAYRYDFPVLHESAAHRVLREQFGLHWSAFQSPSLWGGEPSGRVMERSGAFDDVTSHVIPYAVSYRQVADFVAFLASMSFVQAFLRTVATPNEYLAQLEQKLRAANGARTELIASLVVYLDIGVKR